MKIMEDLNIIGGLSKLCAILPMFRGNGDNFQLTKKGQLYSYLICLILFSTSMYFCMDVLYNAHKYKIMKLMHGDTEEINQTIETLFCIISYTMIVISCVYNSTKHFQIYKDIAKIDEYLVVNGYGTVYKCPYLAYLLGAVAISVIGVAFFYIHVLSDIAWKNQFVLLVSYTLQMIFSSVFALYLRLILMNLQRRVEFVNQKLSTFTQEKIKDDWRELSNLIEVFCKFRYIVENMNTVTGVALLFFMGYAFYTVTNQSYLAFSTLTTHVMFREKFDTMGLSVVWVIAEIITMAVICTSCDAMSSEANTTSQILARVYGKSKEYQNIIDKFLTKSIKQEVQFTAYGFFVIDNSTLFKIFSAVTTYLVILIQFKQLEDSKMEDPLAGMNT